ncbi:carbohydrate binding domain-containing protein, partial [Paraglaciecola sp.]|uniref:carbohydrate binding domain-containing protein n=1 Tax=Paraglaciecola sp. TaxID=1920173 RepID=UPI00273F231D
INHNFAISVNEASSANVVLVVFENEALPQWAAWDCCGGSTSSLVTDDAEHDQVTEFMISGDTVVGFTARTIDGAVGGSPFNASGIASTGTVSFDLKMTKAPDAGVVDWKFKVESTAGASNAEVNLSSSQEGHSSPILDTWQTYTFNIPSLVSAGLDASAIDLFMVFPAWGSGNGAEFYIDNLKILDGGSNVGMNISGGSLVIDTSQGIDFEGTEEEQGTWETFENGDPSPALEFVTNPNMVGNTSTTVAKLTPRASAPCCGKYAGVVSHTVESFNLDASNAVVKIWVYKDKISPVGIKFEKFNGDGYGSHGELTATNTKVNEWEELTIDFSSKIGLPENSGITGIAIFPDMVDGRATNAVTYFDNITFTGDSTGGGETGGGEEWQLISNGDFENGSTSWIGNAANAVNEGGNSINQADVQAAGNPWDVNLSQVMTLTPNSTYELTFKAKASINRNILAGLGLNADPWTNITETVALTTEWQTFTYTITTTGFGDANSRVLFDLGAEVGIVSIDDVSVMLSSSSGGNTGGGEGSGIAPATVDFEVDGSGNNGFTWTVFENDDNPAVEFVNNPDNSGINGSSTVAKFTARQTGQAWAGAETAHGDITTFTLDSSNNTVKVMVYKSVISDVGIKFAINSGGAQGEIKVANTVTNQWEELTFDFSGYIGLTEAINIDQLIIFPDFNLSGRTSDTVSYFDNISFGN